jgi:hypothetical protein
VQIVFDVQQSVADEGAADDSGVIAEQKAADRGE